MQWLKPYTDEVLVELGQKGVKSLLAVPVRYVFLIDMHVVQLLIFLLNALHLLWKAILSWKNFYGSLYLHRLKEI